MEKNKDIFVLSTFDKVSKPDDLDLISGKATKISKIIDGMSKEEKIAFMEENYGSLEFMLFNLMWETSTKEFKKIMERYINRGIIHEKYK